MKAHAAGRVIDTVIIARDPQNDLALLKASESPLHYFALSRDNPYPLQDIIVAGFPFGEDVSSSLKFTRGIVSSLTGIGNNYSEIQIDAALQPGNSGGPIMDEYGNIIAVAVAKLDLETIYDDYGVIPENTNFGIKVSAVRNLMEGNRVPLESPNTAAVSNAELSRIATDATVYLTCWMTSAQIEEVKSRKVMFDQFK
jgi:S1-C subfamily serine protease